MSVITSAVSVSRPELARRANETWFSAERQLPAPRRIVLYQTATSQQLGYLDEGQRWRRLNGQTEPDAVISWVARKRTVASAVKADEGSGGNAPVDLYISTEAAESAAVPEASRRISQRVFVESR